MASCSLLASFDDWAADWALSLIEALFDLKTCSVTPDNAFSGWSSFSCCDGIESLDEVLSMSSLWFSGVSKSEFLVSLAPPSAELPGRFRFVRRLLYRPLV